MLSDYAFYKKLIIDSSKIDSDLSHFPVAIPLGASVGLTDADVTDIFDEVGADYLKIAVFMADQSTELYVEVEQWDATNEKGLLWVSRDIWTIASASDTEIYLAFSYAAADNTAFVGTPGNRMEVWKSDLAAVYTLAQDPSGGADCIVDSTGNGNHGTPSSGMISGDLVDGQIGKALNFDGSDDFVSIKDSESLAFGSVFTCFFTIQPVQLGDTRKIIHKNSAWNIYINSDGILKFTNYGNIEQVTICGVSADTLYRIVFKVQNKSWVAYKDGVLNNSGTFAYNVPDSNVALYLGADEDESSMFYSGRLDRSFLLASDSSEAWIKADDHALTDNLLTFGATQSSGVTTEIADISLDLAAYYQARSDLAAMLEATDGTVLQDLTAALQTYGQSVDDLPAALAAYFQDRQYLAAHLTTWAAGRHDLTAALRAMGLGRDNLPAHLQTVAWSGRDLATVLAAVTPLVFRDLGLTLTATDGTVMENLATVLAAVKRAPQYRSVVAQRIRSVISEVS